MKKRILALALAAAMIFELMPSSMVGAFAMSSEPAALVEVAEEDTAVPEPEKTEEVAEEPAAPEVIEEEEVSELPEETEGDTEVPAEEAEVAAEPVRDEEQGDPVIEEPEAEEPAEEPGETEEPAEEPGEEPEEIGEPAEEPVEEPEVIEEPEEEPAEEPEEIEEPSEEPAEEPEEPAAEEPEEEPVSYPERHFSGAANTVIVDVDAPEGAFPEGTQMKVVPVYDPAILDSVAGAAGAERSDVTAVDISFWYEGAEVEPLVPISVKLTTSKIAEAEEARIVHVDDAGEAKVIEEASIGGSTAEFAAAEFSVYAVVTTGENARLKVIYLKGETEVASMITKKADISATSVDGNPLFDQIIYDPGIGQLDEGEVFRGWTTVEDYTVEGLESTNKPMTIDDIRTAVKAKLNSGVTETVVDGENQPEEMVFYAMTFKVVNVTFKDEIGIVIKTDGLLTKNMSDEIDYLVDETYVPKTSDQEFQGWNIIKGSAKNKSTGTEYAVGDVIPVDTEITVSKDLVLQAKAPAGAWLIFKENGTGASYTPPQFLEGQKPTEPADPTRLGYTFKGWYTEDDEEFDFDKVLERTTEVYAKWEANETAPYMVIFWTQNLERNGYEVADSYVNTEGAVGQPIPYTVVDNGDETYVTGAGDGKGHFIGFCLTDASKGQEIEITPEGDAVLNLYYDRIDYNFRFYIYRDGNTSGTYDYPDNSGNGSALGNLVTWHTGQDEHPTADYEILSETNEADGRTYYYFVMKAYYGEDISDKWPTYGDIHGVGNNDAVSFVMMVGTALKPTATNQGSGTVKGKITVLNENILGATNNANGNYVMVRFPDNYYNWRYHIWFEAVDGEDYGDKPTRTYGTKTYYQEDTLVVRSSNTQVSSQNEPKYTGFDFLEKRGQNWNNDNYWTTTDEETGATLYNLNYVYDRQQFRISYFDGNYVDGNGYSLDMKPGTLLHESDLIGQGVPIAKADKEYEPDAPDGFVFEGWYIDEGCTIPYEWDKMVLGGIQVHAKWRQIEYRVFLNTNVPESDTSFEMGGQKTSFRVEYGGKIADGNPIIGIRDDFEIVGWYLDEGLKKNFNFDAFVLNDTTVTDEYDRTRSTETNIYSLPDEELNKDEEEGRFWITRSLDLYAKWRKKIVGAEGITVVYEAGDGKFGEDEGGGTTYTDPELYKDSAQGIATTATTPNDTDKYEFETWKILEYNGTEFVETGKTVLPGDDFEILISMTERTENDDHTEEVPSYTYTFKLVAQYKEIEEEVKTHIDWYANNGTTDKKSNSDISMNEPVDIEPDTRFTYDGFEFIGWARWPANSRPESPTDTTNLWLEWDPDEKTFTENILDKVVTQVACDERNPYHDLYAVWRENEVTINYAVSSDSTDMGTVDPETETVKASSGTAEGSTATPASAQYEFDFWSKGDNTTSISTDEKYVPEKTDGVYEERTYYAHFKLAKVTVTVHHYLKGTTTKIAEDVTEEAEVGSTYTAAEATEFLDKYSECTFTLDGTIEDITVDADSSKNVVSLYYTLPLKVEAVSKTKVYDGDPLDGEYSIDGALEDDTDTILGALGTAPSITEVSESPLDYLTEDDRAAITGIPEYYVPEYKEGTLEITPADISSDDFEVSEPEDVPYNGKDQKQEVTVTDKRTGKVLKEGTDYKITYSEDFKNVGTVDITVEGKGNYTGTVDRDYDITRIKVTVKIETISKVYDGDVLDASIEEYYAYGTVEGLVNGEVANVILTGAIYHVDESGDFVYESSDIGYTIEWAEVTGYIEEPVTKKVSLKNIFLTASAADRPTPTAIETNYEFDPDDDGNDIGRLEITPAPLTITTEGATKVYDGKPLTNDKITLDGVASVDEDQIVATATGSQTKVGESDNTYELDWGEAQENDYEVTEKLGKLKVTEPTDTPPSPPTSGHIEFVKAELVVSEAWFMRKEEEDEAEA